MLRTLGASRRQILTSVMVEALAIGLLGAVLGLSPGFLIAKGINALFEAFGIDLPTTAPGAGDADGGRLAADRRSSSPSSPR